MNTDFRRNVLTTIAHLLKKISNLKHFENLALRQSYSHAMQADVQLLRNDLILILNQNFYLQCKLVEKDKVISELEKKCFQLQESSKLNIKMIKNKYEKLLHNLKYQQFLHQDSTSKHQMAKNIAFSIQSQFKNYSSTNAQELPTPKKSIIPRNVKSSLENRQIMQKNIRNQQGLEEQAVLTEIIDFEAKIAEGVKSQQINKLSQNRTVQKARSNQLTKNGATDKKKSHASTVVGRKSVSEGENCKQQQLKLLVTQQFKVPALKQRYFCTDLQ